jgi:uncharacterized membrane protein
MEPIFTSDAVVLGMLLIVLAAVFYTSSLETPGWKKFYTYVPALLLCYFLPALLHWPLGLIAAHWYDPSFSDLLAMYDVTLPSGMSYDAITEFLKEHGVPDKGYNALLAMSDDSLKELFQKKYEIAMPDGLSLDEKRALLVENGIHAKGFEEFQRHSQLYYVASRYLLPASLVLLCISIDFKGLINLGPKALIMFFAGTLGIVIGGPIALYLVLNFAPNIIAADADQLWRGLSTVAGSWIGGGANQNAMAVIYEVVEKPIFPTMIIVDVVVANIWMGFLLYGANISTRMDKWLKADSSAITELKEKMADYKASVAEVPTTTKLFVMLAIAFGAVALSHFGSSVIVPLLKGSKETLEAWGLHSLMSGFFWLIVIATAVGIALSFTRARKMEGVGASNWGSIFIFILVATIGMKMNLGEVFENLGLFAIGIIWMIVHVIILLLVAKLIRAPFFFVAVGSQANVGGAASAPVVASAFSPSLAPVGALMAVLGYGIGTIGAIVCAEIMRYIAGG